MKRDTIQFISVINGVIGGDYIQPLSNELCIYTMDNRDILCEYTIIEDEIEVIVNNRLTIYGQLMLD